MSPTTTTSSPHRPFDKLPRELLQFIVILVRDQDRAFHRSRIRRARRHHLERPEDYPSGDGGASSVYNGRHRDWAEADAAALAAPLEGKWSCWLGRGIAALSLVNKQFRGMTFLSLCEVVTLKQMDKPIFHTELLKRPEVVSSIHRLNLKGYHDDIILRALRISPLLPITHVTFDRCTSPLTVPDRNPIPEVDQLLQNVRSFSAHGLAVDELEHFFRLIDCSAMRELEFLYPAWRTSNVGLAPSQLFTFEQAHPKIIAAFRQMSSLETLTIGDNGSGLEHLDRTYNVHSSWLESFSLPALRTLSVWANYGPDSLVELIAAIAPNLQLLTVRGLDTFGDVRIPPLPSLRDLVVHIEDSEVCLQIPPDSSLVTLTINASPIDVDDWLHTLRYPSTFPSSLRLITLSLKVTIHPQHALAKYRSECLAQGVSLRIEWSPDLYTFGSILSEDGYGARDPAHDSSAYLPSALDAARDTMAWASRTLERAATLEDERTMHEIIQALMRVRERQAIELQ